MKSQVIVEINKGRAWWACAKNRNTRVIIVNHDEGIIRFLPIDVRDQEWLDEKTEMAEMLEKDGLTDLYEKKMRDTDPELFLQMKKYQQREKDEKGGECK